MGYERGTAFFIQSNETTLAYHSLSPFFISLNIRKRVGNENPTVRLELELPAPEITSSTETSQLDNRV